MTTSQWVITLVVTLLAGGAMGAVINAIVNWRRNRIQPIGVQKEIIPFVNRNIASVGLEAKIVLTLEGETASFENLSLGQITLRNTGSHDYEEFNFGVNISGLTMAVLLHTETPDRYHEVFSSPRIDFKHMDNEIDFCLKPFNRNDTYSIVLGILPEPGIPATEEPEIQIDLVTKHPVIFVALTDYRAFAKSLGVELIKGVPYVGLPIQTLVKRRLRP